MDMQAVIDLARPNLNDADKDRYSDDSLLVFAINYLQEATKSRPDLFFRNVLDFQVDNLTLTSNFPLAGRWSRACADYIVARSKMLGTEDSNIQESVAYMQLASGQTGVR